MEVTMRWILLIAMVAGCGDTFESQLFLEGETDGTDGGIEAGTLLVDSGSGGGGNLRGDSSTQGDTDASGVGDSSPIEAGSSGDGDAPDATPDTSDGMTCDPYQCQVTCASQGKLCSECGCV